MKKRVVSRSKRFPLHFIDNEEPFKVAAAEVLTVIY